MCGMFVCVRTRYKAEYQSQIEMEGHKERFKDSERGQVQDLIIPNLTTEKQNVTQREIVYTCEVFASFVCSQYTLTFLMPKPSHNKSGAALDFKTQITLLIRTTSVSSVQPQI